MKNINSPGKTPCATGVWASGARPRPIGSATNSLKPSNNLGILICDRENNTPASYNNRPFTDQQACKHSPIGIIYQVKELARHADIRTSQIYVHNAMTDLIDIVNRDNVVLIKKTENQ